MNNRYIAGFVAVLVMAPLATSALTAGDVQMRIQELLAKVAEIKAQINTLQGVGSGVSTSVPPAYGFKHRFCGMVDSSLMQGQRNDTVRGLQEFLRSEGFLNAEATGYFGALTKEALIRYQASHGLIASSDARTAGAGLFGPKTKERIRAWCGGGTLSGNFSASPTRGEAPLTVTFSSWVGGFRPAGVSYMIDFGDGTSERAIECSAPADACVSPGKNTHTYTSNGTYTATLSKITDPCPDDGDPTTPRCLAAVRSDILGTVQVAVGPVACTKEYRPVCGLKPIVCVTTPCNPIPTTYSNRCMMEADGASFSYEGQCRTTSDPSSDPQCKTWFDGCNSCARSEPGGPAMCTLKYCSAEITAKPYCTGYFGGAMNKAPTISGFSGPTKLATNETGTWSVQASDPEGQHLSYSISWGDEREYGSALSTSLPIFSQSASFTHSYSNPGTYVVSVVARDVDGKEAKVSLTVHVTGDAPTACTLQYDPVCGRPSGCANTCAPGMMCTMECRLHNPLTYSNSCFLNAAKAEYLYAGECR